jgi:diadenosine tetraphosphate (Ap4A) HIT family hydrolase
VGFAGACAFGVNIQPSIPERDAMDTIFHKIIRREIPADIVFEDEHVIAFRDIAPQAPVHVLFVPKVDIATLDDLQPSQTEVVGRLALAAADYARREGFAADGYRIVMNCNGDGGQTVFQIHLHLLAGAPLGHFGTAR